MLKISIFSQFSKAYNFFSRRNFGNLKAQWRFQIKFSTKLYTCKFEKPTGKASKSAKRHFGNFSKSRFGDFEGFPVGFSNLQFHSFVENLI